MAGMFGKISVAIGASTRGLTAGLKSATTQLSNFAGIGAKLGKINLLGALKAFAVVAAVRQISAAMGAVVKIASSVVEQQNRIKIVFGQSAQSVLDFAKSASSVGLSEVAALNASGAFGTLFTGIGATQEQAAQFSTSLTKLAADMSSFNEVSTDDALRALRSALVGEVEPIRKLGVLLNDAALRQEAFAMGLVKTTRVVLTPQQKLLASYQAIFRQTRVQQGDVERNANTLANQQKKLVANTQNLLGTIGNAFMPIFNAITTGLNDIMPSLSVVATMFVNAFTEGASAIAGSISLVDGLNAGLRLTVGGATMLVGVYQLLKAALLGVTAQSSLTAEIMYRWLDGMRVGVAEFVNIIENKLRKALEYLTFPIQGLLRGLSEALLLLGSDGFAGQLNKIADDLATLSQRSSGLGQAIEAGIFGDMADIAAKNAEDFGKAATQSFEEGLRNITDPFAGFDKAMAEHMASAGNAAAGPVAAALGAATRDALQVSAESLKAITVGSAAGEEFRNAIMRGQDPRLAQNDQKIADNTGRAADGIAALPDALGARLGAQFAVASVSV